jgi:hypothetical protein
LTYYPSNWRNKLVASSHLFFVFFGFQPSGKENARHFAVMRVSPEHLSHWVGRNRIQKIIRRKLGRRTPRAAL